MTIVAQKKGQGDTRVNIYVIPGIHAENLADETCLHFEDGFVKEFVKHQSASTTVHYFKHNLKIEDMKSWDNYFYMGKKLLLEMRKLITDGLHDPERDSFILMGHKLGVFTLKSALIAADQANDRAILDSIDLLMLFGDPQLSLANRSEWIKRIEQCYENSRVPKSLCIENSAQCLQEISDCFNKMTFMASLLRVESSRNKPKKKHHKIFKRRHRNAGCICFPMVHLAKETTQTTAEMVSADDGDLGACTFSDASPHFRNLIEASDTTVYASIKPRRSLQHLLEERSDHVDEQTESACSSHCGTEDVDTAGSSKVAATDESSEDEPVIEDEVPSAAKNAHGDTREPRVTPEDESYDESINIFIGDAEIVSDTDASEESIHGQDTDGSSQSQGSQIAADDDDDVQGHISNAENDDTKLLVGREDVITKMKATLLESEDMSRTNGLIMLLHGTPGVGKTRTAECFVSRYRCEYTTTAWIRAESLLTIGQSFHRIAIDLGLISPSAREYHEASREKVYEWCEKQNSPWLLVYDNCSDLPSVVRERPRSRYGRCIITSREPPSSPLADVEQVIHLEPLSSYDAMALLKSSAPAAWDDSDVQILDDLINWSGGSPLAIRQIAAAASRSGLSYRQLWADYAHPQIAHSLARNPTLRELSSSNTLTSPLERLLPSVSLSQDASSLLALLCFLDPEQIDESIIWNEGLGLDRSINGSYLNSRARFSTARDELWRMAVWDIEVEPNTPVFLQRYEWHQSSTLQELCSNHLDDATFLNGFQTATLALLRQWPSERKIRNLARGRWREHGSLHRHTHSLVDKLCHATGLLYPRKTRFVRRSLDPSSFLSKPFLLLLIQSIWYNYLLGNAAEDRDLLQFIQIMLQTLKHGIEDAHVRPSWTFEDNARLKRSVQLENLSRLTSHICYPAYNPPRSRNQQRQNANATIRLLEIRNLKACRIIERPTNTDQCPPFIALFDANEEARVVAETLSRKEAWSFDPSDESGFQEFCVSLRESGYEHIWVDELCGDLGDFRTSRVPCHGAFLLTRESRLWSALDRKTVENQTLQPDEKPQGSNTVASQQALTDGLAAIRQGELVRGTAYLTKARDEISTFQTPEPISLNLLGCASIFLAHVYCEQGMFDMAENFVERLSGVEGATWHVSPLLEGQIMLVKARTARKTKGKALVSTVRQHYDSALELFTSVQKSEFVAAANLLAFTQMKLAELYQEEQDFASSQSLLQQAIDHWESRVTAYEENQASETENDTHPEEHSDPLAPPPSEPVSSDDLTIKIFTQATDTMDAAQAQLARATFLQSQLYSEQRSIRKAKTALAAAKCTLDILREQRAANSTTTANEFDDSTEKIDDFEGAYEARDFEMAIREIWMR